MGGEKSGKIVLGFSSGRERGGRAKGGNEAKMGGDDPKWGGTQKVGRITQNVGGKKHRLWGK